MAWTTPRDYIVEEALEAHFDLEIGSGGDTEWLHDRPACIVYRNADQNISQNTATAVVWTTEEKDTDSMWAVTPNPTRITVPSGQGGIYLAFGHLVWHLSVTTGSAQGLWFRVNGSTSAVDNRGEQVLRTESGIANARHTTCEVLELAASDYVELYVWNASTQTTPAILNAANQHPYFGLVKLRDADTASTARVWPGTKTYTPGRLLSTSDMNAFQRDALNYLYHAPAGQGYREHSTADPIPNSPEWRALPLDVETVDTHEMHAGEPGTTRLEVKESGIYIVTGSVGYEAYTTATQETYQTGVAVRKNGQEILTAHQTSKYPQDSATAANTCSAIAELTVGDYLELVTFQHGDDGSATQSYSVSQLLRTSGTTGGRLSTLSAVRVRRPS